MTKKSFLLYADLKNVVDKLPDETKGKLFQLILNYVNGIENVVDDLLLSVMFEPIKSQLNRDNEKWETIRDKRVKAGKASAEKRQQMSTHVEQNPTHVDTCEHLSTVTVPVNVNVNVNDTVNDTVNNLNTVSIVNSKEKISPITKMRRESLQLWKKIAAENQMRFTKSEWEEIYGYIIAKPSLQPHQITTNLRSLYQWANEGLDIKDSLRSGQNYKSLAKPKTVILHDRNNKRIYGQGIIDYRNHIIKSEEMETEND